jgi:hypothetical protein
MHKRLAHPFDVLERLDEQFENTLHWSDPPRLSEWARFILHAYIFLGVSLLLFPLFLLREVRYPCCFRQRWVAALLLLSWLATCCSILLGFIASLLLKEDIFLPLTIGAFALLLLVASLARKQTA